jgi:hypothetical protein
MPNKPTPLQTDEGLEQIKKYRDKIDTNASAYLVIFDRRDMAKGIPWDERIYWKDEAVSGGVVLVVGR